MPRETALQPAIFNPEKPALCSSYAFLLQRYTYLTNYEKNEQIKIPPPVKFRLNL